MYDGDVDVMLGTSSAHLLVIQPKPHARGGAQRGNLRRVASDGGVRPESRSLSPPRSGNRERRAASTAYSGGGGGRDGSDESAFGTLVDDSGLSRPQRIVIADPSGGGDGGDGGDGGGSRGSGVPEPWDYLLKQITAAMANQPPATPTHTPTPTPSGRGLGSPPAAKAAQTICLCVSQLDDKRAKASVHTSSNDGTSHTRVLHRSHTLAHRWLRKAQTALAAENRGKHGAVAAQPLRWLLAIPLLTPQLQR